MNCNYWKTLEEFMQERMGEDFNALTFVPKPSIYSTQTGQQRDKGVSQVPSASLQVLH